jgi:hydrogenase expression/formation protein HypD
LKNFSIFCNHVLTPSAIGAILDTDADGVKLDGFVGPAHVSVVIGTNPYAPYASDYKKPVVISGFEPLDVLQSILMLVRQVNEGRHVVENQYLRAVTPTGNKKAQDEVGALFELRDSFEWRGLGAIPHSALKLKPEFARFDAELKFDVTRITASDNPACECGIILRGLKRPVDCKLFGTACTPDTPMGSCMVSSEGACAAHWTYGRFREMEKKAS